MVVTVKVRGKAGEWFRTQEVIQDRQARRGDYGIPVADAKESKKKSKKKESN